MTRLTADWLLVSVGLATGISLATGYTCAFLQPRAPLPIVITKEDVAPPEITGEKSKAPAAPEIRT